MEKKWYMEDWTEGCRFGIAYSDHFASEKSPFQQIDFYQSEEFGTFFTLDGFMMCNQKDEFIYHDMIVHPALATNPNIKKVLIIGGGDGGTAREVSRYKHIEQIDMVEIDERVVRLCQQYLPQTSCALDNDARIKMYFEDGLAFVKNTPEKTYDLILVDSTDPISVGEGLFTVEFYENCFRALTDDGILINQHESPYFAKFAEQMVKAHDKINKIFPIAMVYQFHMPTYQSGHWLFGFASKKYNPLEADLTKWEEFGLHTKYYNTDIHKGAFALPTYVKEQLKSAGGK